MKKFLVIRLVCRLSSLLKRTNGWEMLSMLSFLYIVATPEFCITHYLSAHCKQYDLVLSYYQQALFK